MKCPDCPLNDADDCPRCEGIGHLCDRCQDYPADIVCTGEGGQDLCQNCLDDHDED